MSSIDLTINRLLPSKLSESVFNNHFTFVGIDFGTSTTVVSVASIQKESQKIETEVLWIPQLSKDGASIQSGILPSVIACVNKKILVGEGAANLKFDLKKNRDVWYSFKMELGTNLGASYAESILNTGDEWNILNAKDAARVFFKYLKIKIDEIIASKGWSKNIQYAVSIPASFEANQRKDLIECLDSNGMHINNQSLIDEPNAAFISYVWESTVNDKPIKIPDYNSNILVFDFGAGTCDISILEVGTIQNEVYSKNLSISKFERLGGDDVDRMVAFEVLMPQLFRQNNVSLKDFRSKVINKEILPKLLKSAETLKIQICKGVSILSYDYELPEEAESDLTIDLDLVIEIPVGERKLTLKKPSMTYNQFSQLMKKFTAEKGFRYKAEVDGQEDFISIFMPIESALSKAKLNKDDIDSVLLIGGSSKNPYIQYALKKYFKHSQLLVPKDTQIQVSRGAAIHSLVLNGLRKNIIKPITSEPIIVITKEEIPKVLIPASAEIPYEIVHFDDLYIDRDNQSMVELPICIGNSNKLLFNVKIVSESGTFKKGDNVNLSVEISADKVLYIRAAIGDQQVIVTPVNPFLNKELTTEERIILEAEKKYNDTIASQQGVDSEYALKELYKVYSDKGAELKAAETLEEICEKFPSNKDYNQIGLHYGSAGFTAQAIKFYKKEYELNAKPYAAFNLAHSLKYIDEEKYKFYLNKVLEHDGKDPHANFELGKYKKNHGEVEEGESMIEIAFNIWKQRYDSKTLSQNEYSWLASAAREMGNHKLASEVIMATPSRKIEQGYDSGNLLSMKE